MMQWFWAFLGSLGFSLLYNVRGKNVFLAALSGMLGWMVYSFASPRFSNEFLSYFLAAMVVTLSAEAFARWQKAPATTFLIAGIIPLVPGKALFYTMRAAVGAQRGYFLAHGALTLSIALAIAAGIMAASSLMRTLMWRMGK